MTLELIKGPMPDSSIGSQLFTLANDTISTSFLQSFLVLQSPKARMQLAIVMFIIITDRISDSLCEVTLCRVMWLLQLLMIKIASDGLVFGFQ